MNSFKPYPSYDIEVFDNVFDPKQIEYIYGIVQSTPLKFNNFDYDVPTSIYDHQLPKLHHLIIRNGRSEENWKPIVNLFKPIVKKLLDPLFIQRCGDNITMQLNSSFPSTIDKLHWDKIPYQDEESYTNHYYANSKWDVKFRGKTLFYNDQQEIITGIIPKPGRFVVFKSEIYHSARPPQSNCPYYRFSIAIKLKES